MAAGPRAADAAAAGRCAAGARAQGRARLQPASSRLGDAARSATGGPQLLLTSSVVSQTHHKLMIAVITINNTISELPLAEVLACSNRGLSSPYQLNMPTSIVGLCKRRLFARFGTSCKPSLAPPCLALAISNYMFQKFHKVLVLQNILLPPFQNVDRFDESRYIIFTIYLRIMFMWMHNKKVCI
jgi:hypothetical protein